MTISRVGFTKSLGDTIAWPGGHAVNDLAVVFAHVTGANPTISPPSGWFTLSRGTNVTSRSVFFRWADSDAMASAAFINSEFLHMWVGRGNSGLLSVGGEGLNAITSSTTTWSYNGIVLANWEATSVVLASACSAATDNTAYTTAPTGMTNLDSQLDVATQVGASNLHESGLVSSWGTQTVAGTGTAGVITRLICEVFEMPAAFSGGSSRPSHPLFQQVIG